MNLLPGGGACPPGVSYLIRLKSRMLALGTDYDLEIREDDLSSITEAELKRLE